MTLFTRRHGGTRRRDAEDTQQQPRQQPRSLRRLLCRPSLLLLSILLLLVLGECPAPCLGGDAAASDSGKWTDERRQEALAMVREMFEHGFSNYMEHAFPHDELKPLTCTWTDTLAELGNAHATAPPRSKKARGKPYRGFALTLIDSLTTLAVLGHREKLCAGVDWLVRHLDFDVDLRVHMFESNIRILGSLLSTHLLLTDPVTRTWLLPDEGVVFASLSHENKGKSITFQYNGGLLRLAKDLGERLLKAFPAAQPPPPHPAGASPRLQAQEEARRRAEVSPLPYAFVHLTEGVLPQETEDTCAAGAGTFIIEFGMLSALTGDRRFRDAADAALMGVWDLRDPVTHLFPNSFDRRGGITDPVSSLGSGIDSLYEYLAKGYMLFDNKKYLDMYSLAYEAAERHLKVSIAHEAATDAPPRSLDALAPSSVQQNYRVFFRDWYLEADFKSGQRVHMQFNALAAFYPAVQVLTGHVEEARGAHAAVYDLWRQFSALPERYYFITGQLHSTERHYPLRPELCESTYYLYRATGDDRYLDAAYRIASDLNKYARVPGGFATIRDVTPLREDQSRPLDDRMESFFLAETLKYLALTFDTTHWLHTGQAASSSGAVKPITSSWVFSTEGHLFPIRAEIQRLFSDDEVVWELLAKPHPDLPVWDAKRRLDERTRLVGEERMQIELKLAQDKGALNPVLVEWLASSSQLQSPAMNLAHGPPLKWGGQQLHEWAHIFRHREGFFNHPLVSRGEDPATFERDYAYYLRRLSGEKNARVGANALPPASGAPVTPYTGVVPLSFTLPGISVRDALLTPCNRGGCVARDATYSFSPLNAMQCARPTHLSLSLGRPLDHWWSYDREWLRWTYKQQIDDVRARNLEQWKLMRSLDAAIMQQRLQQQQQQQQQLQKQQKPQPPPPQPQQPQQAAPSSQTGSATPPTTAAPPHAGPKHESQFVQLNGKKAQLARSLNRAIKDYRQAKAQAQTRAQLTQRLQQRQQQQQPRPAAAPLDGEPFDEPLDGEQALFDDLAPGDAVRLGSDFTVENEAGSFHVIHHPSASSLTISNLGTGLVEVLNELELQPDLAADERGPLLRTALLTIDDTDAIASFAVHVDVAGICEGTLPAVNGYFGRMPPAHHKDLDIFLRDSSAAQPHFDALATLASMPEATANQDGLLKARLVRAHPALVCSALSPEEAAMFRGNIVLVERGQCTFVDKALHLQHAGAIGMIVWNRSQPNFLFVMGSDETDREVHFPAFMLDEHTGAWLSRCITKNERAFAAEVVQRNSDPNAAATPAKFLPTLRVTMSKHAHASGSSVAVPIFPSFTPLGESALPHDQVHFLSQKPATISLAGHTRRFTVRTQNDWSATVTYDEQHNDFILDLADPPM